MNPHNIRPGQSLFYVPDDPRNRPFECTVAKVGREYATMAEHRAPRMRLENMRAKVDVGSGGRYYLSREEWAAERAANTVWAALYSRIRGNRPDDVTIERIKQAAELLGVKL